MVAKPGEAPGDQARLQANGCRQAAAEASPAATLLLLAADAAICLPARDAEAALCPPGRLSSSTIKTTIVPWSTEQAACLLKQDACALMLLLATSCGTHIRASGQVRTRTSGCRSITNGSGVRMLLPLQRHPDQSMRESKSKAAPSRTTRACAYWAW